MSLRSAEDQEFLHEDIADRDATFERRFAYLSRLAPGVDKRQAKLIFAEGWAARRDRHVHRAYKLRRVA
jgi:hypothetical protein